APVVSTGSADSFALACSPLVVPEKCSLFHNRTGVKEAKCYNPLTGVVYDDTGLVSESSASLLSEFAEYNRKVHRGWGCTYTYHNGSVRCCRLRDTPDYCKGCSSDCSWQDKRLSYEVCGTTHVLTTACWPYNQSTGQCSAKTVASLLPVRGWKQSKTRFGRRYMTFWYDESALKQLPPAHWARLPGWPDTYKGVWMLVPVGLYSEVRDISTGLISKDKTHKDYQVLYSATGALRLAGITKHAVIFAVLAAFGARWCLFLYALWLWVPEALA
nr:envelope protein E2 [Hepacivirus P]